MMKKGKKLKYKASKDFRPNHKQKYYLKSKWIYTILAILLIAGISIVSAYLNKQQSNADYIVAKVVRVVDGDTIIVSVNGKEERVRMIGVDAPESVSADEEENSVYGSMAAEYTKQHLNEGMTVYLTFDRERADQYERMLAYIWISDDFDNIDNLYQKQLVQQGYALAIKYEPNTLYWQHLYLSMQDALNNRKGLWADDVFWNKNKDKIEF